MKSTRNSLEHKWNFCHRGTLTYVAAAAEKPCKLGSEGICCEGAWMRFVNSTDESLMAYYESVRKQVAADSRIGGPYRLIGDRAKQYAQELQAEMRRRQLRFTPIDWPN